MLRLSYGKYVVLVILMCLIVAQGSATASPLAQRHPALTPLATTPVTLTSFQVVQSRGQPAVILTDSYYIIEGVAKNTGAQNATAIQIQAHLFNAANIQVADGSAETDLPILRPGDTAPFSVKTHYITPNLIDHYTLNVTGQSTTVEPYRAIAVINQRLSSLPPEAVLRGEVLNTGARAIDAGGANIARVPVLFAMFYDTTGHILAYTSTPLSSGGHLNPGRAAPFVAAALPAGDVASWETWVRVEVLAIGQYAADLVSVGTTGEHTPDGGFTVRGQVTNRSHVTVTDCANAIVFRDAQGGVLNFDFAYLWNASQPLGPGETRLFEQHVPNFRAPGSFATFDLAAFTNTTTNTPPPTPTATPPSIETPSPTVTPSPTPTLFPTPIGGWPYQLYLSLITHTAHP